MFVRVEGRYISRASRARLAAFGLRRSDSKNRDRQSVHSYFGNIKENDFNRLSRFCRRKKLKCYINNGFAKRSADYRQVFFDNNTSNIFGGYFCAYCGRPMSIKHMTVDHLYPIDKVRHSLKYQKKLKKKGYTDINDAVNLVPACAPCNSRKGAKTGFWIIRGKIGRIQPLWYLRWTLRIVFFSIIFIQGIRLMAMINP